MARADIMRNKPCLSIEQQKSQVPGTKENENRNMR